jgi:hypothetical protein
LLRPGLRCPKVRFRLGDAAPGLLDCLACCSFIGVSRGDSGGAGLGRRQRTIVNLHGNVLLIYQLFVPFKVVLRVNIIGLGFLHLILCSGKLFFGGSEPRDCIFDARSGET